MQNKSTVISLFKGVRQINKAIAGFTKTITNLKNAIKLCNVKMNNNSAEMKKIEKDNKELLEAIERAERIANKLEDILK